MKNYSLLILFAIVISCKLVKAQDSDFNNNFFTNHIAFYSLGKFNNSTNILIYDKNSKISSTDLEYSSKSNEQKILISHSIPTIDKYLLLSDYIINENLAVISFADSNKKKYIVYTLKRKNKEDKSWFILSVYENDMN